MIHSKTKNFKHISIVKWGMVSSPGYIPDDSTFTLRGKFINLY